jgi:fluoroacetyl-CoA thioesterase
VVGQRETTRTVAGWRPKNLRPIRVGGCTSPWCLPGGFLESSQALFGGEDVDDEPFAPVPGAVGVLERRVEPQDLAEAFGNPGVRVLATPALLGVVELAAHNALLPFLPEGWVTLGTMVELQHLRATPPGFQLRAVAVIRSVDRRRVLFDVEVRDDVEVVGRARHERFCLPEAEFLKRVRQKLALREGPAAPSQ